MKTMCRIAGKRAKTGSWIFHILTDGQLVASFCRTNCIAAYWARDCHTSVSLGRNRNTWHCLEGLVGLAAKGACVADIVFDFWQLAVCGICRIVLELPLVGFS
jgi:hypothetical protein